MMMICDVGAGLSVMLVLVSDLFDGDGWPPVLVLLQDGQAHRARRVDVGMKYRWLKFA